jgi:hypothetical protein
MNDKNEHISGYGYDFYPTSCVFSIPETWDILFITYLPPHTCFFLTLLFKWRGVGIHDVITKIYHMSVVTLISWKICDSIKYVLHAEELFFMEPF